MSVNSIREILLTRGDESDLHPDPETSTRYDVCDVWIKRHGYETLPGIFYGHIYGTYHTRTASIHLNSVVYEPGHFAVPRWQVLLRLKMLETLVHEVGHHRWWCDQAVRKRQPDSEKYAVSYAARFVPRIVVPYLVRSYRAEVDGLLSWLERQVGIRPPFATLVPDRSDAGANVMSELTSGCAVEDLARAVVDGVDRRTRRLDFARDIHHGTRYDEALQILDPLLADDPSDFKALDLRACILYDQDRLQEARSLARWLTIRFRTNFRAWGRLSRVCQVMRDWPGVVEATTGLLALTTDSVFMQDSARHTRARAHYELGDLDAALLDLDQISPDAPPYRVKPVAKLRAEIEAKAAARVSPDLS